jgi:hypothetical protein
MTLKSETDTAARRYRSLAVSYLFASEFEKGT